MKLESIQILRGIAAWMIVIYHFIKHFNYSKSISVSSSFYGQLGVDIFFVISGFIMALILSTTHRTTKDFLMNRVIRIVPTYWFWTMMMLIVGFLINDINILNTTNSSLLMSLFFITHNHPSEFLDFYPVLSVGWTLNIEMFFYILIAFVLFFKLSPSKTLFIVGFTLLSFVVVYKMYHIEFYKEVIGNARLLEFMFGIILHHLWKNYMKFFFSRYFMICLSILTGIVFVVNSPETLKFLSFAVLVVYFFLMLNTYLNTKNILIQKLVYLGEISYSTYLSHIIVILVTHYYIGEITSILQFIYIFIMVIICTYYISRISNQLIEIRISNVLKKLFINQK